MRGGDVPALASQHEHQEHEREAEQEQALEQCRNRGQTEGLASYLNQRALVHRAEHEIGVRAPFQRLDLVQARPQTALVFVFFL